MRINRKFRTTQIGSQLVRAGAFAVAVAAATIGAPQFAAAQSATDGRMTVASGKTLEQLSSAIASLLAENGRMVMAEVDRGKVQSMAGPMLQSTLFPVGDRSVGEDPFEQNDAVGPLCIEVYRTLLTAVSSGPAAGLYVPLGIAAYADTDGKAYVQYDKPSARLGRSENEEIATIARMLDELIGRLATMAAQ